MKGEVRGDLGKNPQKFSPEDIIFKKLFVTFYVFQKVHFKIYMF